MKIEVFAMQIQRRSQKFGFKNHQWLGCGYMPRMYKTLKWISVTGGRGVGGGEGTRGFGGERRQGEGEGKGEEEEENCEVLQRELNKQMNGKKVNLKLGWKNE